MNIIDLTKGLGDHGQYKAWKFPGGEIHIKFKDDPWLFTHMERNIVTRLNSSDDIMLLGMAVDALRSMHRAPKIIVHLPYMPYAQADRRFFANEPFSLQVAARILNGFDVDEYTILDAHSDVAPALLKNCRARSAGPYLNLAIEHLHSSTGELPVLISPDAGGFKRLHRMADEIGFAGSMLSASKYRDEEGVPHIVTPPNRYGAKPVLVVDDIAVGGRTFIELSKALEIGTGLHLYVTHGIFSNGFDDLLQHYDTIYTTSSRADSYDHPEFGTRIIMLKSND